MMDSACAEYDVLQTAVFGLHQQRVFLYSHWPNFPLLSSPPRQKSLKCFVWFDDSIFR